MSHPVPDRERILDHPYPDLASVGILHNMLAERVSGMVVYLNKTSAFDSIRSLSPEEKCVKSTTPKKLHWVWFGAELPEKYVSNIEEMALFCNPGWEVFLWSEMPSTPLRDHLKIHGVQYNFKNITKHIEEGLFVNGDLILMEKNLAGKSDYLRLEVVYLEGGIYQDTDAHPVQPFDNFGNLFRWPVAAYDTGYNVSSNFRYLFFTFTISLIHLIMLRFQNVGNGISGFEKGSKFLEFAIQLTRENCNTYHNCGVMTGAGPDFLTAALHLWGDPDILLINNQHILSKTQRLRNQSRTTLWMLHGFN